MQLPLTDGRAVRMIVALLAAADPYDRLPRGGSADTYHPLAVAVLAALRSGADVRRIVWVVQEHRGEQAVIAPHDLVVGFAEATVDWWANAALRWADPIAI